MFKTKITEMLGIEYPIVQGGMMWVSSPELAAAVSNAGGLGMLTSAGCANGAELREDIKKTKALTDKPFGVNLSLFPAFRPLPNDEYVDVICDEAVAAVESSGFRAPDEFVPQLRQANVKVIHKCVAVRHALAAQRVGVDAVTVVGVENGGHTGMVDVTSMVLIPAAADALSVPVIGGGGVADARGFLAVLALGADGVIMGTRFMATKEAPPHDNYKQWLVTSNETDTMLVMRSIRNTSRVLKNPVAEQFLALEAKGATIEELGELMGGGRSEKVIKGGDLEAGMGMGGQCIGLIHDVPTAKEVIDGIIEGARETLERLNKVMAT